MTPNDSVSTQEYTPEELKAIYARFRKQFTVEKLIDYLEDDGERFPVEQVLEEARELVRRYETPPEGEK